MATKKPLLFLFFILFGYAVFGQDKSSSESSSPGHGSKPKNEAAGPSGSLSNDPLEEAKSTFNKEEVVNEIKAQLATMASKQLKELVEFCKKNDIKGDFLVDLTVEGKGKVITVLMVSTPEILIPKKNMLKDKLGELQFENIKLPKKQRVKFRYTLKF